MCDNCKITQQKLDALEWWVNAHRWAFVHRDGALKLVRMIRDECEHKNTDKTAYCQDGACAAGCDVWEGKE